ncbi:MAG: hypothetical protein AAF346_03035 [Pseudomonadota bacterium]
MTKTIPVHGDVSPEAATAILDALLLSVIHAHPDTAKFRSPYQRLNEAKSALFGIGAPRGRKPDDDLQELMYMAAEYIADRGTPEIGADYKPEWSDELDHFCRPAQALAREAIRAREESDPSYVAHSEEKMRNLQQKFSRHIGDWLKLSYAHGGLKESVFQLKVQELAELLSPLGIRVDVSSDLRRDAKSVIYPRRLQ